MKWVDDIIDSVGKIDELTEKEVIKRERLMNIGIIGSALIIFLLGAELLIPLAIVIPFNRASKVLFREKMSFHQRWAKLFTVTMKYLLIVMLVVFILEHVYPPILKFYSLKLY